MENINLENKNMITHTGRDKEFDTDKLAFHIAKVLSCGEYLNEDVAVIETKKQLLKALVTLEELQDSFWTSVHKMISQAKELEDSTKKATGKAKDAAQKLNDGLLRIEKTVNIAALEKRVELLERAADAMERLNALQQTGKLDKILEAIK
jgi:hypothetical protein